MTQTNCFGFLTLIDWELLERGCIKEFSYPPRVKKLVKGRDGKTRGAVVETVADNQNRLIEISRAVQNLVPVECKEQGTCQQSQPGARETRTRRQAAIISDIRRRCLR